MPTSWVITVPSTRVKLDGSGRGEIPFTVANAGPVQDRAVFELVLEGAADQSWFSVDEPQRVVPPGTSVTYVVRVAVPAGTPAGGHGVQGRVYSADTAPEESSAVSSRVVVEVPASGPPSAKKPWWLIPIGVAVLAVIVVVVLLVVDGEDDPTPEDEVELEQPALWPAADVVFETPEAVAADFVSEVLGVRPELGEFQQGDARSGEIAVLAPGEGGAGPPVPRGTLLLRRLGPDEGWFVIATVSDNATITTPEPAAEVPAGSVIVEGRARGSEGTVVVSAFLAGRTDAELDQTVTRGGAFPTPEPYAASVDLEDASRGDTVALLVQGGSDLRTDPGDFAAIPVVVSG